MDKNKQRLAIARACDINWIQAEDGWWDREGLAPSGLSYEDVLKSLPDYLNDLNAMHEAEKKFTDKQKEIYVDLLFDIAEVCALTVTFATASQRAEAFLRALSLWEE